MTETTRADEWVAFAKAEKEAGGSVRPDPKRDAARPPKRPPHVLPSVAEWFLDELRCGVLEPTPDPGLPEEEEALTETASEEANAEVEDEVANLSAAMEKLGDE